MTFGYVYARQCASCGIAFTVHDASSEASEAFCVDCRTTPTCGCCQLGAHYLCLAHIWPVPVNCGCPCFVGKNASERMSYQLEPYLDPPGRVICIPCDVGIHEDCSHEGCTCDDNYHSHEDDNGHVD